MKQISTIIISLLLYVSVAAQSANQTSVDTLLLVPMSRIQYCMAKVEQVNILDERIIVKDKQIDLALEHAANKEQESRVWENQYNSAASQRDINEEKLKEKEKLLVDSQNKVKSQGKQILGLKIGGVALIILALLI